MGCSGSSAVNPPISYSNENRVSSYVSKRNGSIIRKFAVVLDCANEEDFEVVYLNESDIKISKIPISKYFSNGCLTRGMKIKVYFTIGTNQIEKVEPMNIEYKYAQVVQLTENIVRLMLWKSKRIVDILRSNIEIPDLEVDNYVKIIQEEDEILEFKLTTPKEALNSPPIRRSFTFQRKSHEPGQTESENAIESAIENSTNPFLTVARLDGTEEGRKRSEKSPDIEEYDHDDVHNESLKETCEFGGTGSKLNKGNMIHTSLFLNPHNEVSHETILKKYPSDVEFTFVNDEKSPLYTDILYKEHSDTEGYVEQIQDQFLYSHEHSSVSSQSSHHEIYPKSEEPIYSISKQSEHELIYNNQVTIYLFDQKSVTSEVEPDSQKSINSELANEPNTVSHFSSSSSSDYYPEYESSEAPAINLAKSNVYQPEIQELAVYTDQDLEILAEEKLLSISKYRLPLHALKLAFKHIEGFSERVDNLAAKFESWTRSRGDGNGFYRSIGVSYLEYLFRRTTPLQTAQKFLNSFLSQQGIYSFDDQHPNGSDYRQVFTTSLQHMIHIKAEVLDNLDTRDYSEVNIRLNNLFQNEEFDLVMIKELRSIAANYLVVTEDIHAFLVDSLENQLKHMRTMGNEASRVEITCMSQALKVNINNLEVYDHYYENLYPVEGSDVELSILFKPGHYDILKTYQDNYIDKYSIKKLCFMDSY